ncbi:hypothetical protein [Reichenbachiella versicolor]|uniref:hypothetical protein n=1 Tax=Reichenbachiella versicolor TaxID=1821036 RepID=UPI000D6DCC27|nr:hypothetical protein [Reichenbachiella versicolor]
MSREEVRTAIDDLLSNTPEQGLLEVLAYLKSLQGKAEQDITTANNLRTILMEDSDLLKRLAQ